METTPAQQKGATVQLLALVVVAILAVGAGVYALTRMDEKDVALQGPGVSSVETGTANAHASSSQSERQRTAALNRAQQNREPGVSEPVPFEENMSRISDADLASAVALPNISDPQLFSQTPIKNLKGERLGTVSSVALDRNGRAELVYANVGERLVTIDASKLMFVRNRHVLVMRDRSL